MRVTGKIVSVTMKDDKKKKESHVIYLRETAEEDAVFSATTKDDDLAEAAILMAALQTRGQILTAAKTCPDTSTATPDDNIFRLGQVGTIVSLTANQDTTISGDHRIQYRVGAQDVALFSVDTDADAMVTLAATLLTSQTPVEVISDALICPDEGDAGTLDSLAPQ